MKRDLRIILSEMLGFIERCKVLTESMEAEAFKADMRTHEAIYSLVIKFGEASAILQRDHQLLLARYPVFPARSAADMRNRLIHGYWNVNLELLFDVATRDIPATEPQIEAMLRDCTPEGQN